MTDMSGSDAQFVEAIMPIERWFIDGDGNISWAGDIPLELYWALDSISRAVFDDYPRPTIIYAARHLIAIYDHKYIPSWIDMLAFPPLESWDETVNMVRELMKKGG
jgi:hypothetical protein